MVNIRFTLRSAVAVLPKPCPLAAGVGSRIEHVDKTRRAVVGDVAELPVGGIADGNQDFLAAPAVSVQFFDMRQRSGRTMPAHWARRYSVNGGDKGL